MQLFKLDMKDRLPLRSEVLKSLWIRVGHGHDLISTAYLDVDQRQSISP